MPRAELSTELSVVVHAGSGRRIDYGEIAALAEAPATAPKIKPSDLKNPKEFRLIGQSMCTTRAPQRPTPQPNL